MNREAIVSEDFVKKFAKELETPYTRWVKAEGLDIIDGIYVRDLNDVALKPWQLRYFLQMALPEQRKQGYYILLIMP